MVFSRKNALLSLPSLKIYNKDIPKTSSVKFLRIYLDSKLSGKLHLIHLIRKGSTLINILSSLSGTWWGSYLHLLLSLYRAIFRGSFEYGCQIFRYCRNKTIWSKFERLQYRAIRTAMRYRISTSINIILYEAREIPFKFRFNYLSKKFLIKCFSRKLNPVISCLDALKSAAMSRTNRITLLRSFPIFKTSIFSIFVCMKKYVRFIDFNDYKY